SRNCRACGKFIFTLTPTDLFQDPDSVMLHQIEALTGLFLLGGSEFPAYICGPCELALMEAIRFRERVFLTQKTLQSNPSVAFALDVLDINEIEGCIIMEGAPDQAVTQVVELVEEVPLDAEQTQEDPALLDQLQLDSCVDIHVVAEEVKEALGKLPAPATSVIFGDNKGKYQPRIDWNKLTEEETVAMKRERRKRDCICEQCGRHFSCPSNFKIHLLRHTGVKSFACPHCPQKFYTPHLVRRHQVIHTGERPYPCQYCDMAFNNVSGRIQHERIRHTSFKPYKCTECDKSFAVSGKLRTHMLSHTGIRSFHCESCKVSFIRRSHLMAHYRSKAHAQNSSMQDDASKPSDLDVE
ncbi:hypothetical protein KR067_013741, partial [Drosophila pandora]